MLTTLFMFLLVSLGVLFLIRCEERGFESKWPPISDVEFLSRCPAGTNPNIALRVRDIVSEQSGIPKEQIYPEQSFVDDLPFG